MSKIDAGDVASGITAYLENYPNEVIRADDPTAVYDRYHAAEYAVVSDGLTLDRDRQLAHVAPAKKRAAGARVTVHEVVTSGNRFAAYYTLEAEMRKGGVIATEIAVFGEVAPDGRIASARQLTRDVSARASTS
jgi:hypothetical protein